MESSVEVNAIVSEFYEAADARNVVLLFVLWINSQRPHPLPLDAMSMIGKYLDFHQKVPIIHDSCLLTMELVAEFVLRRNYFYWITAPTVKRQLAASMEEVDEAVRREDFWADESSDGDVGSSMGSPVSDSSGNYGEDGEDDEDGECPSYCSSDSDANEAYKMYVHDILVRLRENLQNSVYPAIHRQPTCNERPSDPKEFYIIVVIEDVLRNASHVLHEGDVRLLAGMDWLSACVMMLDAKGIMRDRCFSILKQVYCDAIGYDAILAALDDDCLLREWFENVDVFGLPGPFDEDDEGSGDF